VRAVLPRAGLLVSLGALAGSAGGMAQEAPDSTCGVMYREVGSVREGQLFDAPFGPGLRLRLDPDTMPTNPGGWTIRVLGPGDPSHDLSMVATPPYRFWNPRYLDTSYGTDAARAVAIVDRRFRFVLSDAEYETAFRALGLLLWPAGHTETALKAARDTLKLAPTGRGVLHIVAATTRPPSRDHPGGVIETLAFSATLCVPQGRQRLLRPEPDRE